MKKALFFIAFILIGESFLGSCMLICPCGCDSGPAKQMDILNWKVSTIDENFLVVDVGTTRAHDGVFKAIQIGDRNLVSSESESNLLYKAAYGCSPAPLMAAQSFSKIQIISKVEVPYVSEEDIIKVGDDITDRFVVSNYFTGFMAVNDFTKSTTIYDQDLYLFRLNVGPYQQTDLRFDIIITLSDGKISELKDEQLVVF